MDHSANNIFVPMLVTPFVTVLQPNSVEAIKWGLSNFDGAEFDVRISKDDVPVIHHDTYIHNTMKKIQDLTADELSEYGIETLEDLLTDPEVIRLCNDEKRILWLELKPDCKMFDRILEPEHTYRMYGQIDYVINNKGGVEPQQINIFSFSLNLLEPFTTDGKYRVYGIVPDIDECDTRSGLIRKILSLGRYLRRSLIYHGNRFKEMGLDGIMFPHQYVDGIRSLFHPSMEKVEQELRTDNFDLVTQSATIDEEREYVDLIRFTDFADPRYCPRQTKTYTNHIAIHRGCGVHPLEIS